MIMFFGTNRKREGESWEQYQKRLNWLMDTEKQTTLLYLGGRHLQDLRDAADRAKYMWDEYYNHGYKGTPFIDDFEFDRARTIHWLINQRALVAGLKAYDQEMEVYYAD